MSRIRPWRLLRSEVVFDHHWYRLRRDWLQLPDGRKVDDYFVSVRPEVVLVFAVTDSEEVVLVRQYKHGSAQILLEFPGGIFRADEEGGEVAAARELVEETGYVAGSWELLGKAWDDPTRQDNRIHLYLARGARLAGAQALDEHEDIEVVLVPLRRVREMCLEGEICVTGSLALAFLGLEVLGGRLRSPED
jgi:ADP-ribose pyrophosphatase